MAGASPTEPNNAIKKALEDVTAAADSFRKLSTQSAGQNGVARDGVNSAGELTVSHNEMFIKAMHLVRAIRGPVDMTFAHFENVSVAPFLSISIFSSLNGSHRPQTIVIPQRNAFFSSESVP